MFAVGVGEDGAGSRRRFTGHERDQTTSWDYMLARFVASSLARFLSIDPAGDSAFAEQPQSWNRYASVLNSPLILVDPDGRYAQFFRGTWSVDSVMPESQSGAKELGVQSGVTQGPRLIYPRIGTRAREGATAAFENDDGVISLFGFSRGAHAAAKASRLLKEMGKDVDLLVLLDPELRNSSRVPDNVKLAVMICNSNGRIKLDHKNQATSVVKIMVSGSHNQIAHNEVLKRFLAALAHLAQLRGRLLTKKDVEDLARSYGLEVSGL